MRLRHLVAALAFTALCVEGTLADPIRVFEDFESAGTDRDTDPDPPYLTTQLETVLQHGFATETGEPGVLPGSFGDAAGDDGVAAVGLFSTFADGLSSLTLGKDEPSSLKKRHGDSKHKSHKRVHFKHKKHREDPVPVPIPIPEPSTIATLFLGVAVIGLLGRLRGLWRWR